MTLPSTSAAGSGAHASHIGVEPFHVLYGVGNQSDPTSPLNLECELVEDAGEFRAHRPKRSAVPQRIAFVDGTMRVDARLTITDANGGLVHGVAGCWAAGAVLAEGAGSPIIERVETGRATVFCEGRTVRLPAHQSGWEWESHSIEGNDPTLPWREIQDLMRTTELRIAEALVEEDWRTVVDGPLRRLAKGSPAPDAAIGYVKTHHRRLLAAEEWGRVPTLAAGERSGVFAIEERFYSAYLRVGDAGRYESPWGGVARIEVPQTMGREAAIELLDEAAAWLPDFASPRTADARAPVNLVPIVGLEKRLRHLQGDARLARRAVSDAVRVLHASAAGVADGDAAAITPSAAGA